jgi:hypothetical protein
MTAPARQAVPGPGPDLRSMFRKFAFLYLTELGRDGWQGELPPPLTICPRR